MGYARFFGARLGDEAPGEDEREGVAPDDRRQQEADVVLDEERERIEVVVQLDDWDSTRAYDRTGLDGEETKILDVALTKVVVPLNPGKNITVISEIVAMRHLLRFSGVDSAREFNDRLIEQMQKQRQIRGYLEEDYE